MAQPVAPAPVLPDASPYDVQDNVRIPTRDGATLIATIVRNRSETGRVPAVLFYTPYYQGPGDARIAEMAAKRGYVGIISYARGIRNNLNMFAPYEHDGDDAYDVIDWISRQAWSNGKVGMYGGSYAGFVQWSTARNPHPALKTIVPQAAVMPGFDAPMENNVCQTFLCLGWPNDILQSKPLPRDMFDIWYANGGAYQDLDALAGQRNRIFQKWLQHPAYDGYWKSMVPSPEQYAALSIPVLTTTGYYDGSQIAALQYYKLHARYNPQAEHYLVIGPYDHHGAQKTPSDELMGYAIDPVARISMRELAFQWLDYILKGAEKPPMLADKINYQVMGTDQWRHAPNLDAMNDGALTLYLASNSMSLSATRPVAEAYAPQTVDMADRTTQNNYFTPVLINENLDASNGLVYLSAPAETAYSINGSLSGVLSLSSNKRDLDFSIAFYEARPDGKFFFLTRHLGRASFAADNSERQLLMPGVKTMIPIAATRMVSKRIGEGSRLAIVLNVNKHPYDIINYGSGKPVSEETIDDAGTPMRIQWHDDSYITVPIHAE